MDYGAEETRDAEQSDDDAAAAEQTGPVQDRRRSVEPADPEGQNLCVRACARADRDNGGRCFVLPGPAQEHIRCTLGRQDRKHG